MNKIEAKNMTDNNVTLFIITSLYNSFYNIVFTVCVIIKFLISHCNGFLIVQGCDCNWIRQGSAINHSFYFRYKL